MNLVKRRPPLLPRAQGIGISRGAVAQPGVELRGLFQLLAAHARHRDAAVQVREFTTEAPAKRSSSVRRLTATTAGQTTTVGLARRQPLSGFVGTYLHFQTAQVEQMPILKVLIPLAGVLIHCCGNLPQKQVHCIKTRFSR